MQVTYCSACIYAIILGYVFAVLSLLPLLYLYITCTKSWYLAETLKSKNESTYTIGTITFFFRPVGVEAAVPSRSEQPLLHLSCPTHPRVTPGGAGFSLVLSSQHSP